MTIGWDWGSTCTMTKCLAFFFVLVCAVAAAKFRGVRLAAPIAASPVVTPASGALYPLKASANGRYLVNQPGAPFLMLGDAPQGLIVSTTTADAAMYLRNRASNGVNTLWVNLLCNNDNGAAHASGDLLDGTKPFTSGGSPTDYDLSTTNEAYFAHADLVLNMAATNGITVMLDPIETTGWLVAMRNNSSNICYGYGQFLGNRYKNQTNLIWLHGNDYNTYGTASDDFKVIAVAKGIISNDTNHLHTGNVLYVGHDFGDSLALTQRWDGIITANGTYSYVPTYDIGNTAYVRTNLVPIFFSEGHYEYESVGDANDAEYGTANVQRRQAYWSTLTGGLGGYIYGSFYTWKFSTGWQTNLNSPGLTTLNFYQNLLTNRAWYALVPSSNVLVSAGYGTYTNNGTTTISTYATAAKTADGTLGMVYTPTNNTLTVQMTNFSNSVTSRWFDPSAGTFTAITGSPFANTISTNLTTPGNNAAGQGDWVLLLESAP